MKNSAIRKRALRAFNLWIQISSDPYKWIEDPLPGWTGLYLRLNVNDIINRWKRDPKKWKYFGKTN